MIEKSPALLAALFFALASHPSDAAEFLDGHLYMLKYPYGGGLAMSNSATVDVVSSMFYGNEAGVGGGILGGGNGSMSSHMGWPTGTRISGGTPSLTASSTANSSATKRRSGNTQSPSKNSRRRYPYQLSRYCSDVMPASVLKGDGEDVHGTVIERFAGGLRVHLLRIVRASADNAVGVVAGVEGDAFDFIRIGELRPETEREVDQCLSLIFR